MAKCPNCNASIAWNALTCPKCPTEFGEGSTWRPVADSAHEARLLKQKYVPPEPPYALRGIALANISLGLTFGISSLFSPVGRILKAVVDLPIIESMPAYQGHLLVVTASYVLPATVIYALMRFTRVASWIKPTSGIQTMIGIANLLLVSYLSLRVFASTIQGGGPSFVVMSLGVYVIVPAWALLLSAGIWLTTRSIRRRGEILQSRPFGRFEGMLLMAALALPAVFFWSLFFDEAGPFRLARQADKLFRLKCESAGERILKRSDEEVKGLYLDPNSSAYFVQIVNGVYGGHGGGLFGEGFVNSGSLLFFEEPNPIPSRGQEPARKYRRYSLVEPKWQLVDQLESRYGVYTKALGTDADHRLGIGGAEVSIVDLASHETLATTTYFISSRQRRICGNVKNGEFHSTDFITRVLSLKRPTPISIPKVTQDKK